MKENIYSGVIAAALGALSAYLGNLLVPIIILTAVMLLDYVTGMVKAWVTGTLCSRIGIKGIIKKVGYLVIVAVAGTVDYLIRAGLTQVGIEYRIEFLLCLLVVFWLIINELISILENLAAMDVPVPGWLLAIIRKLKKVAEEKTEAKA